MKLETLYAGQDAVLVFDPDHQHVLLTVLPAGKTLLRQADRETAERIALAASRGAFRPEVSVEDAELLARSPAEMN